MSSPAQLNASLTTEAQIPRNLRGCGLRRAGSVYADCESHGGRPEMAKCLKMIKNKKAATAIEYGLIAALIAVAEIGAMQGVGNKLNTTFNNVSNSLG